MAVSINIELEGFSDPVTIRKLTGTEEMSTCFKYDVIVELQAESAGSFDPIGNTATLVHLRDDEETNRVVSKVSTCVQLTDTDLPGDKARFSLHLVPDLWFLGLTEKTKIYPELPFSDIISDQLDTASINHELADLSGTLYREKHLICQYKESSLNFVNRMLEDRGVYYYFDHSDDGKVIVADSTSHYGEVVELDVNAEIEPGTWTAIKSMAPTKVRLTGYDYINPENEIFGEAEVADDFEYEVHVNDEPLLDQEEAEALAQVRLEQRRIMSDFVTFRSFVPKLSPGRQFSKGDSDYLVTKVVHTYVHEDTAKTGEPNHYRNSVHAIRSDILFRPTIRAIKPRAAGTEIAHIHDETENNEEGLAMLDERGRYTVLLNYVSDSGENKVTQLRMQQSAAGEEDGVYFPLKKGVEVAIAFKKGNPDLPYIAGSVPNGQFPSHVNSDNSHHSVIKAKHLLAMQSLGGFHSKHQAKGHDGDDHKIQKLTSKGKRDRDWTWSANMSAEHERSGEFHVNRRYGDLYSYVDGCHFYRNKDGSGSFNFGFLYQENHEIPASRKEEVVAEFALNDKMEPFNSSWEERKHGFVEKTWGDKVAYHKGRAMFWGAGEGPGGSLQLYNYGTRYTENHVAHDKGLAPDRSPQHDDGAGKVGSKALTVKTFGDTYDYQAGKVADILVGDSYVAQWGKTEKYIEGDSKFEQKGKVKRKFDGKVDEEYTDNLTVKVQKDVKETIQGKLRTDVSGKVEQNYKMGRKTTDKGRVTETFQMQTEQNYKLGQTKTVSGMAKEEYKAMHKVEHKMMLSESGAKIRKLEAKMFNVENKMTKIQSSMIMIG